MISRGRCVDRAGLGGGGAPISPPPFAAAAASDAAAAAVDFVVFSCVPSLCFLFSFLLGTTSGTSDWIRERAPPKTSLRAPTTTTSLSCSSSSSSRPSPPHSTSSTSSVVPETSEATSQTFVGALPRPSPSVTKGTALGIPRSTRGVREMTWGSKSRCKAAASQVAGKGTPGAAATKTQRLAPTCEATFDLPSVVEKSHSCSRP